MAEYVFRKIRNDRRDRYYTGRLQLPWMVRPRDFGLKTPDKQVAVKRLSEIRQRLERQHANLPVKPGLYGGTPVNLFEKLEVYLKNLKATQCSKQHMGDVRHQVTRLLTECKWDTPEAITPLGFETWRAQQDKLGATTKNAYLISMRSLLNWLVKIGEIKENPLARIDLISTNGKRQEPRAWTDEELRTFLKTRPPYALAVMIAAFTGLRRNEVSQLIWGDVDLDSPEPAIVVRGSTAKNGKSKRIPLTAELEQWLQDARPADWKPTQPVLTYKIPRTNQGWSSDIEAAGLVYTDDLGRSLHFHALRRYQITFMARHGISMRMAQSLARHSDPKLTANVYTDVSQLDEFNAVRKLPPLFGSEKRPPECPQISDPESLSQSQPVTKSQITEIAQAVVNKMLSLGLSPLGTLSPAGLNGGSNWARTSDLIDVNDAL